MIDLAPFCARPHEAHRVYLHTPIHAGDWTIATDGHIAIRTERTAPAPDTAIAPLDSILAVFEKHQIDDAGELPLFSPPPGECDCNWCEGSGHDADDNGARKDTPCPSCRGTGKMRLINQTSVEIDGTILAARYLELIRALPFPKLCYGKWPGLYVNESQSPISFIFEGGIGLLMPMRRPHEIHVRLARPGKVTGGING